MEYDLKKVKSPRLTGLPLRIFANLLEGTFFSPFLFRKLFKDTGLDHFRKSIFSEAPTQYPFVKPREKVIRQRPVSAVELKKIVSGKKSERSDNKFPGISDLTYLYKTGKASPVEICTKIIDLIRASDQENPPLRAVSNFDSDDIIRQAKHSETKFKQKRNGILEGIPVLIKEELNVKGYGTAVGTQFLGKEIESKDAFVVERLRRAGAVILGQTNMFEIGISATGNNPHHGFVRNPYNPEYDSGGSSSGSAAAVAGSLCSFALGADGGGSIRIPSAHCGVFGLKATFGRISENGASPLCWSVAHIGPIARNANDLALIYAVIAGEDPNDPNTLKQPPVSLEMMKKSSLKGITIGIYEPWYQDAEEDIVNNCNHALAVLKKNGAKVKKINLPFLEPLKIAHAITILSEMARNMDPYYNKNRKKFCPGSRINLALGRKFTSRDYIMAQQVRTLLLKEFESAYEQVDVILTPTTAITALPIQKDSLPYGESDLNSLTQYMKYILPGNHLGYPAISVPVGYDRKGLPVGLQIMGRFWEEDLLLQMAMILDKSIEKKKPVRYYDFLGEAIE
ncbi:MAG: amidase [Spirochaetia bacterium]|nr:amidase [Spirochaetia bacterium]